LLQEVKEAHLTHGLADDLFYASMLIENEAKETLKNFMIKSSKGKADQEDKVLSLQKLYVMNAGGFLAKVEYVKPRVYKKKQGLVMAVEPAATTTGPSARKLQTQLETLVKDIGFNDIADGEAYMKRGFNDIKPKENKQARSLLERASHWAYKRDQAREGLEEAQTALNAATRSFKKGLAKIPDEDDQPDEYASYRKALKNECKKEIDNKNGWGSTVASSEKQFNEVKSDLDGKIESFGQKLESLKKLQPQFAVTEDIDSDSGGNGSDLSSSSSSSSSGDSSSSDDEEEAPKTPAPAPPPAKIPRKKRAAESEKGSKKKKKKSKKSDDLESIFH
jgi:hypothetical protein